MTVVTWETQNASERSLQARAVGHAANPLAQITPVVVNHMGPLDHAVDGDGQQFVVAHSSGQLYCTRLSWNGLFLAFTASDSVSGTIGARSPAIGWLGDRYLVAWQQPSANPFDSDVLAQVFNTSCAPCSSLVTLPTNSGQNQVQPAVATQTASGGPGQDALLAWNETSTMPSFAGGIGAHRFARMVGSPPVVLSQSCPGGGTANASGPFALGNQQFRFTLTGGDPAAFIAVLALSVGAAPTSCGCLFSQPQATYLVFPVAGAAEQPFPVPCQPTLLGLPLEAQWFLFGAQSTPCPTLPNLTGSSRVLVTITE